MKKRILLIIFSLLAIASIFLRINTFGNHNIISYSYPEAFTSPSSSYFKYNDVLEDKGIFSEYYEKAIDYMSNMSLEEKIGQLLLVRYEEKSALKDVEKYHFGGFVFFEKDFANKDKNDVVKMIDSLQNKSKTPIITATDEEGGLVVRVSSNPKLSSRFKSIQSIYKAGGFQEIEKDTVEKSRLLNSLGINLNLAPVVDVSTNKKDYIYSRTLGHDAELTSFFSKTVINASKNTGVSYTLKHFPGYGNNKNTHNQISIDSRSCETLFENDILPFKAGIEAGAEAIMVNHNIVKCFDDVPASLSTKAHDYLRDNLEFTGIIMTDSIDMAALNEYGDKAVRAITSGNDIIITTDYKDDFQKIKNALNEGTLKIEEIEKHTLRVIAWKYYKGLLK